MILNIIDERKRPYRWRAIDAIVEPTWHDNSCAEAAPSEPALGESDYEEKEGLSVSEAVAWADALTYPVTLYLRDLGDLN